MSWLLIYMYASVAIVLAAGSIFDDTKQWLVDRVSGTAERYVSKFLYCPMCIGFWVGFVAAFLFPNPGLSVCDCLLIDAIVLGCTVATTASFIYSFIKL